MVVGSHASFCTQKKGFRGIIPVPENHKGLVPFATTFGVFATARAGDQLRSSIAYPKANVKVAATHCGISTGGDGASHQANEDIAIARCLPNMTVLVPAPVSSVRQPGWMC